MFQQKITQHNGCSCSASDRLEQVSRLLSHDLRNSLRALAELPVWIAEELDGTDRGVDATLAQYCQLMTAHATRADQMVIDLATFARITPPAEGASAVLGEAFAAALTALALPDGVDVRLERADLNVPISLKDLTILVHALVSNSLKHRDMTTSLVSVSGFEAKTYLELVICDDGPGIAPSQFSKVLEPMTTLVPRDQCEGSGMGLAIVERILGTAGGSVRLENGDQQRGLCVYLTFPRSMAVQISPVWAK